MTKNKDIVLLYYASNTIKKANKNLEYIFDNERPIYLQLVEILKLEILSGKLKKGERIPSVRELALKMKVNPNTMQRALAELENEKLIYTERTNGKYVTKDEKLIEEIKKILAKEKAKSYIKSMENIGIKSKEAIKYLQELGGK